MAPVLPPNLNTSPPCVRSFLPLDKPGCVNIFIVELQLETICTLVLAFAALCPILAYFMFILYHVIVAAFSSATGRKSAKRSNSQESKSNYKTTMVLDESEPDFVVPGYTRVRDVDDEGVQGLSGSPQHSRRERESRGRDPKNCALGEEIENLINSGSVSDDDMDFDSIGEEDPIPADFVPREPVGGVRDEEEQLQNGDYHENGGSDPIPPDFIPEQAEETQNEDHHQGFSGPSELVSRAFPVHSYQAQAKRKISRQHNVTFHEILESGEGDDTNAAAMSTFKGPDKSPSTDTNAPFGMVNEGMICYLITSLQLLHCVRKSFLITLTHGLRHLGRKDRGEAPVCAAIKDFLSGSPPNGENPKIPKELLKLLKSCLISGAIAEDGQADPAEFLEKILDKMQTELTLVCSGENNGITELLQGKVIRYMTLPSHRGSTDLVVTDDVFLLLQLHVPADEGGGQTGEVTLESCFHYNTHKHENIVLKSLPSLFIVFFGLHDPKSPSGKLNTRVITGETLIIDDDWLTPGLQKEVQENQKSIVYDLMAVISHHGPLSNQGHYTSVVRVPKNDGEHDWYMCDDHVIKSSTLNDFLRMDVDGENKLPYVALYKKKGL